MYHLYDKTSKEQQSNEEAPESNLNESVFCNNNNESDIAEDELENFCDQEEIYKQAQISAYYATTGREDIDSDLRYEADNNAFVTSENQEISDSTEEIHAFQIGEETSPSKVDLDRLKSAKQASLNTMKDMTALSTYLQGEGTLLRNPPRCEDCQANCHGCQKASRLNPTAETTLQGMETNL